MSGISQESGVNSRFHMVDVGAKTPTRRRALASGVIRVGKEAYERIQAGTMPKGDLLALAEVAGIQAAKRASEFIPLCHPLALDQVVVRFEFQPESFSIKASCEALAIAKTGVEMEALAGVQAALLSIYDLTKGVNPALWISDIHLELKEGGKSGVWKHPQAASKAKPAPMATLLAGFLEGLSASVITASDRVSRGEASDLSGPVAMDILQGNGAKIQHSVVVADDPDALAQAIRSRVIGAGSVDLLVVSGGTGLGPRDVSPEALQLAARGEPELLLRRVPGVGELLRSSGARFTSTSWLSRSEGAFLKDTLVLLLPGNPKAVTQGLEAVLPLIPHLLRMSKGGGHS